MSSNPAPSRRRLLTGALAFGATAWAGGALADPGHLLRPAPRPLRAGPGPEALLREAGLSGEVSWLVMDVDSGRILDARAPERPAPPASTLKTVTALYALAHLGPDFRFATRVLAEEGRLVLEGQGDPVLDTDALAVLARQAAQAGLAPPSAFLVWPSWPEAEIAQIDPSQAAWLPYNPAISGLNLNFNRVHLDWRGGAAAPVLALEARGARLSPRAYTIGIRVVPRAAPLFDYDDSGAREEWTVAAGALRQPGSRWLPVRHPALYAGDVFQTLARAEGLALPNPQPGRAGPQAREVARHDSPPLAAIIAGMLDYSTNLTAEVLGLRASGAGDLRASAAAMADWVRGQGIGGGFGFADHSGLSPGSRVSAAMMVALLAGAGRRFGLAGRLAAGEAVAADGRRAAFPDAVAVRAKTGTLNFVSNLVGYLDGPSGRRLAFAVFCADAERRAATIGQELPAGVATWTTRAKHLQTQLLTHWAARLG